MDEFHSLSYEDRIAYVRAWYFRYLLAGNEKIAQLSDELISSRDHVEPIRPVDRCKTVAYPMKPRKAALLKFDAQIGQILTPSVDDTHTSRTPIHFKLMSISPQERAIYPQLPWKAFSESPILDPILRFLARMAAYT